MSWKKKGGIEGLVGVWYDDVQGRSSVETTVGVVDGEVSVSEINTRDNEPFEVSDVAWDGQVLRFVSRLPSNNHRVESEMWLIGADSILLRYTTTDRWKRKDPSSPRMASTTSETSIRPDGQSAEALVGVWVDDWEFGPVEEITIRVVDGEVSVSEVDSPDNEAYEISDISWDGRALRFVARVPSTGHRVENDLRLADPDSMMVRSTCRAQWERKV